MAHGTRSNLFAVSPTAFVRPNKPFSMRTKKRKECLQEKQLYSWSLCDEFGNALLDAPVWQPSSPSSSSSSTEFNHFFSGRLQNPPSRPRSPPSRLRQGGKADGANRRKNWFFNCFYLFPTQEVQIWCQINSSASSSACLLHSNHMFFSIATTKLAIFCTNILWQS